MSKENKAVAVTGAGGFIGGHLVSALRTAGCRRIRAIDLKPLDEWSQRFPDVECVQLDLREPASCVETLRGIDEVYNLASDMGGMGFIAVNRALCMLSVLINTHLLMAALEVGIERYFFASSACVYPAGKQSSPTLHGLRESDAYPAMPEDGYGWEKLFSERLCRHFTEDFGLVTRIARYHNVYGPFGAYEGGREKAPSAICRKIVEAKRSGNHEIEIWGDGEQTRSFMYVDDCVHGTLAIMHSDFEQPINLGSTERVTINALVDIVQEIAGITVRRRYNPDAPQGVRGRNSDNRLIRELLGWEPNTTLREGMDRTYHWIHDRIMTASTPRLAV